MIILMSEVKNKGNISDNKGNTQLSAIRDIPRLAIKDDVDMNIKQ